MLLILMSAVLMAGADAAAPASPAPAAAPVSGQPAHKRSAVDATCWVERPTGSHIRTPICATREELEKAQRDGRDAVTGELRTSSVGFKKKP